MFDLRPTGDDLFSYFGIHKFSLSEEYSLIAIAKSGHVPYSTFSVRGTAPNKVPLRLVINDYKV